MGRLPVCVKKIYMSFMFQTKLDGIKQTKVRSARLQILINISCRLYNPSPPPKMRGSSAVATPRA